jgi:hypothetical protein
MRNTADVTGGKPIAVLLQSISGAINPLVAFYDIHGGNREVLYPLSGVGKGRKKKEECLSMSIRYLDSIIHKTWGLRNAYL